MNEHVTASDLRQRYLDEADSWSDEDCPYEQAKYESTLDACGPGPFVSALELGGSIGVFTELLAPRCQKLTTIDVAKTSAAMARRRLADFPTVEVLRGAIPGDIPERDYDLVVASEILYYLTDDDFERTLALIRSRLISGGRLVAVHWAPAGHERPFTGGAVHARLRDDPWLRSIRGEQAPGYLLDVLERR
jgi:SAM-dependent methyltransferase